MDTATIKRSALASKLWKLEDLARERLGHNADLTVLLRECRLGLEELITEKKEPVT